MQTSSASLTIPQISKQAAQNSRITRASGLIDKGNAQKMHLICQLKSLLKLIIKRRFKRRLIIKRRLKFLFYATKHFSHVYSLTCTRIWADVTAYFPTHKQWHWQCSEEYFFQTIFAVSSLLEFFLAFHNLFDKSILISLARWRIANFFLIILVEHVHHCLNETWVIPRQRKRVSSPFSLPWCELQAR